MTPSEFGEFEKADRRLSRFTEDQEKLGLLQDTYTDYKKAVESEARRLEGRQHPVRVADVVTEDARAYHQINVRVRSVLSEITTFLNYAERHLKHEYGHDSDQFKIFKKQTNIEYDASPSYRFVYQLRNYALHFDVPVNGMRVEDGERDPVTDVVRKLVRVEVDRDKLLHSGYDWRKVQPDIEKFPPRFSLDAHLDYTIKAMGIVNLAATVAMLPETKKAAQYIHTLIEPIVPKLHGKQGTPVIVHWDSPKGVSVGQNVSVNFAHRTIQADLAETVLGFPEPDVMASVIENVAKEIRQTSR